MTTLNDATYDDPQRALDAPFIVPDDWDPIPGTCSRCGTDAWLGEKRWWHDGPVCESRGRPAEFTPDQPTTTRGEQP